MNHHHLHHHDDDNQTSTHDHTDMYHDYGLPVVVTLSFFLATSMAMAFLGNIMVIITILRHPGMRTRTNMLLGNLAVADILVAALDMPVALITIINRDWVFPEEFCYFNGFAVGLGLMLSIHTLMWISIHKYLSITRPFTCNVTKFQIVLMMVAAWAWTIMYNLSATPLIGLTETVYKKGSSQCGPAVPRVAKQMAHSALNTIFNMIIPMGVMIFCYYKIFKEVHNHLETMREIADQGTRNSYIQQKQITMTLLIVLIIFFAFWLPYIVYSLSLVFLGKERVPLIFNPISYLFGYMNSACNPVIYAFRSPSFRRGFKEIICGSSSRIAGQREGLLMSFRQSTYRHSKAGRNQQWSQHIPTEPRKPTRIPRVSLLPGYTPTPTQANGAAGNGPEIKVDCIGAEETQPLSVRFEASEEPIHIPSKASSCTVNLEDSYAPWQPLQPQVPSNHLSRSCQEIVTATSCIMSRSASAGDLPTMALETHCEKAEAVADVASKRRHRSEVHRPLMWQASVDHLTPVGRRRKSAGEKVRAGQNPTHTHLNVRSFIRNFRRSFSDLFSIEEH